MKRLINSSSNTSHDLIKLKLEKAEKSGFTTDTKKEIFAEAKKSLNNY